MGTWPTFLPRTEITKKLWDYIKANQLQTKTENGKPENAGKFIVADAKLLAQLKMADRAAPFVVFRCVTAADQTKATPARRAGDRLWVRRVAVLICPIVVLVVVGHLDFT